MDGRLNLRVDKWQKKQLRIAAELEGCSMSELVRRLLVEWLEGLEA